MKLVALVSLIYFCVYFCQCRFYFQTGSTALFHSMVLENMESFLCLYSLFVLLKRRLLFCDTVYCISFPSPISDYNFSLCLHLYWVAPRICVLSSFWHQGIVIVSTSFCTWRCIRSSHSLSSDEVQVSCRQISASSTIILPTLVLFTHLSTQLPIFFSQNMSHSNYALFWYLLFLLHVSKGNHK